MGMDSEGFAGGHGVEEQHNGTYLLSVVGSDRDDEPIQRGEGFGKLRGG